MLGRGRSMRAALQDALAALATDAGVRRRLTTTPDEALAGWGLDPRDQAALRALDRRALERYARGLLAKRWAEVARVAPRSVALLPPLGALYRSWLADHPARV